MIDPLSCEDTVQVSVWSGRGEFTHMTRWLQLVPIAVGGGDEIVKGRMPTTDGEFEFAMQAFERSDCSRRLIHFGLEQL